MSIKAFSLFRIIVALVVVVISMIKLFKAFHVSSAFKHWPGLVCTPLLDILSKTTTIKIDTKYIFLDISENDS